MNEEQKPLRMSISIRIDTYGSQNAQFAMGNLQFSEEFGFAISDFAEMAAVLGQFHELAQRIKSSQ